MTRDKAITGPGITTHVQMESADLGIVRWDAQRHCNAVMFGDNFTDWGLRGEWQSPSIVCYDEDFNVLGIPTASGIVSEGNRRQIIPYQHGNEEFSTILPCDFIKIGSWWYVAAMVCAGLGNELRTIFWQSRDLVGWEKTNPYVALHHPGHPGNVMLTFDQLGDYVYVYGTGGLARDRGIWLWRNAADEFPHGNWEPWGFDGRSWGWGVPNENTPILVGSFGELCFRVIQNNCVLSFFDAAGYRTSALTVPTPTDDWGRANRVDYAHGSDTPQLYGGYISPQSRLDEPGGMRFLVSQWNTATNVPYHVLAFTDTLAAQGAVVEPPVEPEPPLPPSEPPVVPPVEELPVSSPQELYELLLRELSASGSTKIVTPEGTSLTLRQAIEEIFWKERGLHYLRPGRPRHPRESDDQLGHVINARTEGLFTQAVVVAIADRFDIDVAKLYAQVRESLQ